MRKRLTSKTVAHKRPSNYGYLSNSAHSCHLADARATGQRHVRARKPRASRKRTTFAGVQARMGFGTAGPADSVRNVRPARARGEGHMWE